MTNLRVQLLRPLLLAMLTIAIGSTFAASSYANGSQRSQTAERTVTLRLDDYETVASASQPQIVNSRSMFVDLSVSSDETVVEYAFRTERPTLVDGYEPITWTATHDTVTLEWSTRESKNATWDIKRDGELLTATDSNHFDDTSFDPDQGHLYQISGDVHVDDGSPDTKYAPYYYMVDVPPVPDLQGKRLETVLDQLDAEEQAQETTVSGHDFWWNAFIPEHHVFSGATNLCPELLLPPARYFRGDGDWIWPYAVAVDRPFTESGSFGFEVDGEQSSRTSTRWKTNFYSVSGQPNPDEADAQLSEKVGVTAIDREEQVYVSPGDEVIESFLYHEETTAHSDITWEAFEEDFTPNIAYAYVEHDASDPLCAMGAAPAISYGINYYSYRDGRIVIAGEHDQAPSHEIGISFTPDRVDGEGESVNQCIYQFNNRGFLYLAPPAPNASVDIDVNPTETSIDCTPI